MKRKQKWNHFLFSVSVFAIRKTILKENKFSFFDRNKWQTWNSLPVQAIQSFFSIYELAMKKVSEFAWETNKHITDFKYNSVAQLDEWWLNCEKMLYQERRKTFGACAREKRETENTVVHCTTKAQECTKFNGYLWHRAVMWFATMGLLVKVFTDRFSMMKTLICRWVVRISHENFD